MPDQIHQKVMAHDQLVKTLAAWRNAGEKIVFSNGCFDVLHYGHAYYLAQARALGHRLVVGLNNDASVSRLKGPSRPINTEDARAFVLAALECVDLVVLFEEDTPLELIKKVQPEILVKGGDYKVADIVGGDEVQKRGGQVCTLPLVVGFSSTKIIEESGQKS